MCHQHQGVGGAKRRFERLRDLQLQPPVHGGSGFIEQPQRGLAQKRPRQVNELALPTRQAAAALINLLLQTFGMRRDHRL